MNKSRPRFLLLRRKTQLQQYLVRECYLKQEEGENELGRQGKMQNCASRRALNLPRRKCAAMRRHAPG